MADCSEEFSTIVISSALFHGVPLFFMSWSCGWSPDNGDHFSDPICRIKSNTECSRCRSLLCSLHMHMKLPGMYNNLCNTCHKISDFSDYHLKLSRIFANLQPYSRREILSYFDRGFVSPRRGSEGHQRLPRRVWPSVVRADHLQYPRHLRCSAAGHDLKVLRRPATGSLPLRRHVCSTRRGNPRPIHLRHAVSRQHTWILRHTKVFGPSSNSVPRLGRPMQHQSETTICPGRSAHQARPFDMHAEASTTRRKELAHESHGRGQQPL